MKTRPSRSYFPRNIAETARTGQSRAFGPVREDSPELGSDRF